MGKYLELGSVVRAFDRLNQSDVENKFICILVLARIIKKTLVGKIKPNTSYEINSSEITFELDSLFGLGKVNDLQKDYKPLYVTFPRFFKENIKEEMLGDSRFSLFDLICIFIQNQEIDFELNEGTAKEFFPFEEDVISSWFELSNANVPKLITKQFDKESLRIKLFAELGLSSEITKDDFYNFTFNKSGKCKTISTPGELRRGPYFQPLYSSFEISKCLLVTGFDISSEYKNPSNLLIHPQESSDHLVTSARFVIFTGPPGCGKTRKIKEYISKSKAGYSFLQIHPSYCYEDFVEGIRPVIFPDGELRYEIVEGPFRILAHKAAYDGARLMCSLEVKDNCIEVFLGLGTQQRYDFKSVELSFEQFNAAGKYLEVDYSDTLSLTFEEFEKVYPNFQKIFKKGHKVFNYIYVRDRSWKDKKFVLVLDELNRGNVSQILGELIYLIGEATEVNKIPVKLQYSQDQIVWPGNLSLFATLNTSDVSVVKIDQAIKRRFSFIRVDPDQNVFKKTDFDFLTTLNKRLSESNLKLEVDSLDSIFLHCGAKRSPGEILFILNNGLIQNAEEYGLWNIRDRLLGHSYLIKVCDKLAMQIMGTETQDTLSCKLLMEFADVFQEEIMPALSSLFNSNYEVTFEFVSKLFELKQKKDSELLNSQALVEFILFNSVNKISTSKDYLKIVEEKCLKAA